MEYLERCGKNDREYYERLFNELKLIEEYGFSKDNNSDNYRIENDTFEIVKSSKGNEYKMKKYTDCEYNESIIINKKKKTYRYVLLSDFIDIKDYDILCYDGNVCINCNNNLYFFNENMILSNAGMLVIDNIKHFDIESFVKSKFERKGNYLVSKKNISDYSSFDDEYIFTQLSYHYHELLIRQCEYENPEYKKKNIKIDAEFKAQPFFSDYIGFLRYLKLDAPELNNFCDKFISLEDIVKELKQKHIWKNLKNSLWINYIYEKNIRKNDDFVQGEDFTFLILNLIKAIEFFLYHKLKKYYDKEDGTVSEKVMLNKMIEDIKIHMIRDELKGQFDDIQFNKFKKELIYVKDECRNGYFHKERIDTYESLKIKRERAMMVLIEIAIILK